MMNTTPTTTTVAGGGQSKSWYGLEDLAASEALLSSLPPVPSLPDLPSFLIDSAPPSTTPLLSNSDYSTRFQTYPSLASSAVNTSPNVDSATPYSIADSLPSLSQPTSFALNTMATPSPVSTSNIYFQVNGTSSPLFTGMSNGANEATALAKEVLDLAFGLKLRIMEQHNTLKQLQSSTVGEEDAILRGTSLQDIQRVELRERIKQEAIEREHKLEIERYTSRLVQLEEYIAHLQQQHLPVTIPTPTIPTIPTTITSSNAADLEERCRHLESENEELKRKVETLEQKGRQDKRRIEELLELNVALKTSISEQILPPTATTTTTPPPPPHFDTATSSYSSSDEERDD